MGGETTGQENILHGQPQPLQLHDYIVSEFAAISWKLVDAGNAMLKNPA